MPLYWTLGKVCYWIDHQELTGGGKTPGKTEIPGIPDFWSNIFEMKK
jgi:hypothetical protein